MEVLNQISSLAAKPAKGIRLERCAQRLGGVAIDRPYNSLFV
jgi:hypothetical protein